MPPIGPAPHDPLDRRLVEQLGRLREPLDLLGALSGRATADEVEDDDGRYERQPLLDRDVADVCEH